MLSGEGGGVGEEAEGAASDIHKAIDYLPAGRHKYVRLQTGEIQRICQQLNDDLNKLTAEQKKSSDSRSATGQIIEHLTSAISGLQQCRHSLLKFNKSLDNPDEDEPVVSAALIASTDRVTRALDSVVTVDAEHSKRASSALDSPVVLSPELIERATASVTPPPTTAAAATSTPLVTSGQRSLIDELLEDLNHSGAAEAAESNTSTESRDRTDSLEGSSLADCVVPVARCASSDMDKSATSVEDGSSATNTRASRSRKQQQPSTSGGAREESATALSSDEEAIKRLQRSTRRTQNDADSKNNDLYGSSAEEDEATAKRSNRKKNPARGGQQRKQTTAEKTSPPSGSADDVVSLNGTVDEDDAAADRQQTAKRLQKMQEDLPDLLDDGTDDFVDSKSFTSAASATVSGASPLKITIKRDSAAAGSSSSKAKDKQKPAAAASNDSDVEDLFDDEDDEPKKSKKKTRADKTVDKAAKLLAELKEDSDGSDGEAEKTGKSKKKTTKKPGPLSKKPKQVVSSDENKTEEQSAEQSDAGSDFVVKMPSKGSKKKKVAHSSDEEDEEEGDPEEEDSAEAENSDDEKSQDSDYEKPQPSKRKRKQQQGAFRVKRRRRVRMSDDSDEEQEEAEAEEVLEVPDDVEQESEDDDKQKKRGRKKGPSPKKKHPDMRGRRLLTTKELQADTKEAEKAEKERMERLKEKQKEYNAIELDDGDEVLSDAEDAGAETPPLDTSTASTGAAAEADGDTAAAAEPEGEAGSSQSQAQSESLQVIKRISERTVRHKRAVRRLILDKDGDDVVEVDQALCKSLKVHQAGGVKFMYDATVESFKKLDKEEEEGGGCILAHDMGLGKTLQAVTFIHTALTHRLLKPHFQLVMIIVPKNVIRNWQNEFDIWIRRNDKLDQIRIHTLSVETLGTTDPRGRVKSALDLLKRWHTRKGVLITNYESYRKYVQGDDIVNKAEEKRRAAGKAKKKKLSAARKFELRHLDDFRKYLCDPGPDLVVCDEGHYLKNDDALITRCMSLLRTKRRICLTGTPMQNHLLEYYTMVSFVKPSLLGTNKEFTNRFANPIKTGNFTNSTAYERSLMKRRTFVLQKKLEGVMQRKNWATAVEEMKQYLPEKHEFVLQIRLSDKQRKLYTWYLDNMVGLDGRKAEDAIGVLKARNVKVMPDFHFFNRIWTHPYTLQLHYIDKQELYWRQQDREEDVRFIDDDDDEPEELSSESGSDSDKNVRYKEEKEDKRKKIIRTRGQKAFNAANSDEDGADKENGAAGSGRSTPVDLQQNWWHTLKTQDGPEGEPLVKESESADPSVSGKMAVLLSIIRACEAVGDKLLVFSQRTEMLNFIETNLQAQDESWSADGHEQLAAPEDGDWRWQRGFDYLRIDGSTSSEGRERQINDFNDKNNLRARLFLVSTRAGGIGINLTAANRVVLFDVSWNPSHDLQGLFRVYRFGQTKPVYIYRMVAQGTMEECIWRRQIQKQSMSNRQIDDVHAAANFDEKQLIALYNFEPDVEERRPEGGVPQDRLLADLLRSEVGSKWVVRQEQQDTLLAHKDEEVLSKEEQERAWTEYEARQDARMNEFNNINARAAQMNEQLMAHLFGQQQQGLSAEQQRTAAVMFEKFREDTNNFARLRTPITVVQRIVEDAQRRWPAHPRLDTLLHLLIGYGETCATLFGVDQAVLSIRKITSDAIQHGNLNALLKQMYDWVQAAQLQLSVAGQQQCTNRNRVLQAGAGAAGASTTVG